MHFGMHGNYTCFMDYFSILDFSSGSMTIFCGTYDHQNKRNFSTSVHFKITQHNSQCDNIQTKNNVHSFGMVLLTSNFYFHLLNYLCLQFFPVHSAVDKQTHEVDYNTCGRKNTDQKLC